jgi:hypothetical protein
MRFNNTAEFPQWVKDYKFSQDTYPTGYQEIADELIAKGNEMAKKWRGVGLKEMPFTRCEIDNKLGCDYDTYETYQVFCASKGSRPSEWDHLHDCDDQYDFCRTGHFEEAQIGEWYLVVGSDFD